MPTNQIILMADVVGSSNLDSIYVQKSLAEIVSTINNVYKPSILSPFTITLGDEFQGLALGITEGIQLLFEMEQYRLKNHLSYRLHYVLLEGEIHTDINSLNSYGMLGEGLTEARKLLSSKRRDRNRFEIELHNKLLSNQLKKLFSVADRISESWKLTDFQLILDMLSEPNNQIVADLHQKTRAQIWKRRKTLQIESFTLIREVIESLSKYMK